MKKIGLIGFILLFISGIALAENGRKIAPNVQVNTYSSGSTYMYGATNIVDYNPNTSNGSYVTMRDTMSYISVSMYDIDTGKFGRCYIYTADSLYETAKKAYNLTVSGRGIYISASYSNTSSRCFNFYSTFYSYMAS